MFRVRASRPFGSSCIRWDAVGIPKIWVRGLEVRERVWGKDEG
jgi:hypothetical protein